MIPKRILLLFCTLSMICFLAGFSVAGPPVGSLDESYYEGIWNFRITQKCAGIPDAGMVLLPLEDLFVTLSWDGAAYRGIVYSTLEAARQRTDGIGDIVFRYDSPSGGESCVSDIECSISREESRFKGLCEMRLVGCLKTAVNSSQNPRLSKMSGWGMADCDPDDVDIHPFLKCDVTFAGRWIEDLQLFENCQTNAECPVGYYCKKADGDCSGPGMCTQEPEVCPTLYDPVCGCDGQTYSNSCVAAMFGISVASRNVCP